MSTDAAALQAEPGAGRPWRAGVAAVLALAGAWRLVIALLLPALSRDGVVFCGYARELGRLGVAYLRQPEAQQHPLYPALVLAAQRAARLLGAADTPWTWQYSGQFVAGLAGVAVVALVGAITARLIRRLALPVKRETTVLAAMGLATVLDANIWLSADVMSDQVHLALYLGAVYCLLDLQSLRAALAAGVLTGLAFLVRPEGLMPLAGGLAVLATQWRHAGPQAWRGPVGRATVLLAAVLVLVAPYWVLVGRFSTKKNPLETLEHAAVVEMPGEVPADDGVVLAKLEQREYSWLTVVPEALYKTLRAGRVLVPLFALLPVVNLRKQWLGPVLVGWTACIAGHFAAVLMLLKHPGGGYLHPRHTLVIVALLMPFAALLIGRLVVLARERRQPVLRWAVLAVVYLPLGLYGLRIPNDADRFLTASARWLNAHEPNAAGQRLVSGSSPQRIAFYAGLRWQPWWEDQRDYESLAGLLRSGPPGYFALELESPRVKRPGFEIAGNRALLARLLADETVAPRLTALHVETSADGRELHLFRLVPPAAPRVE